MSGRVVVGIDGSEPAAVALRWAAAEARRRGAALEVVHSWLPPLPLAPQDLYVDYGTMEAGARRGLDHAVAELRKAGGAPEDVVATLSMEHAAPALMEAARGADLLVVGARGRGGFAGLRLGSVSQACVQHAPCPVAVVPHPPASPPHGRIIVGVDGSEAAEHVLRWAADEAERWGATLMVVNAWAAPRALTPFDAGVTFDVTALEEAGRSDLVARVDVVRQEMGDEAPVMEVRLVGASPAHALIEAAKDADLLVVGHRGRGGFAGLLLGSVSQQAVHHASCPVVVVRPTVAR